MNESLGQAVLELLLFLSTAEDETVDPDAAIEQLEQAAALLQRMTPADQRDLTALAERLAEKAKTPARAKALRGMGAALGLEAGKSPKRR